MRAARHAIDAPTIASARRRPTIRATPRPWQLVQLDGRGAARVSHVPRAGDAAHDRRAVIVTDRRSGASPTATDRGRRRDGASTSRAHRSCVVVRRSASGHLGASAAVRRSAPQRYVVAAASPRALRARRLAGERFVGGMKYVRRDGKAALSNSESSRPTTGGRWHALARAAARAGRHGRRLARALLRAVAAIEGAPIECDRPRATAVGVRPTSDERRRAARRGARPRAAPRRRSPRRRSRRR